MATASLDPVLRHIRKIVDAGPALADHELLERFAQRRDETAFEALVRRHGPTVFGVGRRVLHDPDDAADVFQATFLVLARYAHRLGRRGSIGGWLYTVAYRLALKTKADKQRRRQPLPGAARATVVNPLDHLTARDLCGLLDEELQRLPESQRLPLLLCCVDGKARDEAARQLGWSLGQVKAGLERGRKTLVRRLERRGIAFSAGMLAAYLSSCSTSVSVLPVLVAATTQAAMAFAAGQTAGSASAEVVSLASGMLKTMLPSNFKLVLIASFTVGLLGLGAAGLRLLAHGHHALPPASDDKPAADREPPKLDQHGDPLPRSALTRLGTTRLRHSDPVRNMAFQPGGKVLVTVGTDGTLAHWDVATGKELQRLVLSADRHDPVGGGSSAAGLTWGIGHAGGSVLSTVIAGDGTSLAVSGDGGFIRVLDATTAKQRCRIKLPREGIGDMVLSRDGAWLAIVSGARILIWNATTGKLNGDLAESKDGKRDDGGPGRGSSSSLAFAPDGKTLARVEVKATPGKGGNGKPTNRAELTFIDAATGRRVGPEIPAATVRFSWPSPVIYSQDGKLLAWRRDGVVHLTDPASGKELRAFRVSKEDEFIHMEFALDGRALLTRDYGDRMLHVWDVASGKEREKFGFPLPRSSLWLRQGSDNGMTLTVAPDAKIAALGDEHIIRFVDLTTGKELTAPGHTSPILLVQYAADGKRLTSWGVDGTFRLWDTRTGMELRSTKAVRVGEHFALSPDGRTLAVLLEERLISLRDAATAKELRRVQAPRNPFGTFAFSPDGKLLAVQGVEETTMELALFEVASGRIVRSVPVLVPTPADGQIRMPSSDVAGLTFAPDGKTLAALISVDTLGLWDVATGREWRRITSPDGRPIQGVAFSPDDRSLALDVGNGLLSLYESATGQQRRKLLAKGRQREGRLFHDPTPLKNFGTDSPVILYSTRPAAGAAFSPDGRLLAHSSADGTIALWDVVSREELTRFTGHRGYAPALAFRPDGKTLASGGRDTTCLIWDVASLTKKAKAQAGTVDAAARWSDLTSRDAARAFDAICALTADSDQTVRFLKDNLRPAAPAEAEKIAKLIADLDSDEFTVRKNTSDELEKIGESAAPALRKALEGDPSPEAHKRLKELLAKATITMPSGEALRSLRAVEVLEMIATPEARQLLQSLSKGSADARLTREAKASLERLERRIR